MNTDAFLNQNQQEENPKSPHKVVFQPNQVPALEELQELEMKIYFYAGKLIPDEGWMSY